MENLVDKALNSRWRVSEDNKWVEIEGVGVFNAKEHNFRIDLERGFKEKSKKVELWEGGPIVEMPSNALGWVEFEPNSYWTYELSLEIQGCVVRKRGQIDQCVLNLCLPSTCD